MNTVSKCTIGYISMTAVRVQADEVAKLEAEKERILQRLPSFAKPAANGAADRPEDGQAEDRAEGAHNPSCTVLWEARRSILCTTQPSQLLQAGWL